MGCSEHITESQKSIVRQPHDRRKELIELAHRVPNISAKHEGGDPAVDAPRPHPSDILDYFRDKAEVVASGDWNALQDNFMDKLDAPNKTARALTEHGLASSPHFSSIAEPTGGNHLVPSVQPSTSAP
jgi:hypothetical protein